jgi:hypothetical protein
MNNISTYLFEVPGLDLDSVEVQEWLENQLHDPGCTCPVCMSKPQEEEACPLS